MTFIVGLKCADGLSLAADSLESDTVTKRYRNKLEHVVVRDECGIGWGGSGSAYTVDKFSDKLKQIVGDGPYDRAKLEIHVERCLEYIRKMYRANDKIDIVLGMFGRPRIKEKNQLFLGSPEFHLYRGSSETACLSPEKEYACAGMDVTLAAFILSNTYCRLMRVRQGKKLCVFTANLMKEYADGVGGDTNVLWHFVGSGEWGPLLHREIAHIEAEFSMRGKSGIERLITDWWWQQHPTLNDIEEANADDIAGRKAKDPIPMASVSKTAKQEKSQ